MITRILPLILSVIIQRAACQSPQISLSTSLDDGQRVCPGDEITFTCLTNGTATLAWRSEEYIGRGGIQLEFSSFDSQGAIDRNSQTSPIGTFATLLSKTIEENETIGILESVLTVAVISQFQTSDITCVYVDRHGIQRTESFQLLDAPGVPRDVEINERSRNGDRCDFSIQLLPPVDSSDDDIQYYNVTAFLLGQQIRSERIIGTSGTFFVPISNCTTDLRVRVQAVNRCDMPGNITADIVPTFQPEAPRGLDPSDTVVGTTITAIVVSVLAVAVVILIVVIPIVVLYKKKRWERHGARDGETLREVSSAVPLTELDQKPTALAAGPPPPPTEMEPLLPNEEEQLESTLQEIIKKPHVLESIVKLVRKELEKTGAQ